MQTPQDQNEITSLFQELKLRHFGQQLTADLTEMSETERKVVLKYMTKWMTKERSERKSSQIMSRIKSAKFGKLQTVEAFNFKHSSTTEVIEKNYLALLNSISRESLPSAVFSGTAGLGKTHLARSLGYAACQKGLSALFVTAAQMVNHLNHAQKTYSLETELNRYRRPQVLIIDELGYVSLDTQGSNLFFQVISARHDAELGTIATTNIPFGKWNQIFANDAIAHAIVDRLVNDAEVFFMEGPSYRPIEREEKLRRKRKTA
jgi:DNA replication protein DnaC